LLNLLSAILNSIQTLNKIDIFSNCLYLSQFIFNITKPFYPFTVDFYFLLGGKEGLEVRINNEPGQNTEGLVNGGGGGREG
jgi:hypothetical protein